MATTLDTAASTVGVVGIGRQIGTGVVRALARGGFRTLAYDIRPEALEPLDHVIRRAESIEQLGEECEVVFVAVWDDAQVFKVVDPLLALSSPPGTIVVISTVAPATISRLGELAAEVGVSVLDCGVTGGSRLQEHGKIVAMVGGDPEAVAAARPALETFADPVVQAGPLGAGMRAKLARNVIIYCGWYVALEAARLAAAAGVEIETLAQIVEAGDRWRPGMAEPMRNPALVRMPADEAVRQRRDHVVNTMHKDLRGAIALSEELNVNVDLARFVDQHFEALIPIE